jgi:ubiquinone/menaquinone biosynthesis C-methylase UbiE
MSVDKSWQLAGGPGSLLYEIYDRMRRWLNGRIVRRLAEWGLEESGIIIEAGSGTGFASSLMAEQPQATLSIAVDYDIGALREGRKQYPSLCAVVADINHLPFADGSAQMVWSSSTIEHLPDQAQAISEMARVTKSGGVVFVGVPYRWGPLFFQRWIPNTAIGIWLGTVYGRADVEAWLQQVGCISFDTWRYFFWFFIGVAGRKK